MLTARVAIAALAARPFARWLGTWSALIARLSHPYRPERHYMRGPGPKCRARSR